MNTLLRDLRHGLRQLMRSRVFAALMVLALAVGIGVDVALFRLLDAVVMKSPAVRSAESLVQAARGESRGIIARTGIRAARAQLPSPIGDRMGCVHVGVIGIHTTISFRMARRSSEIGVHVALGDAGGRACG